MLADLVANISVGASRKPLMLPQMDGELGQALARLGELAPEAKLISAISIVSQYGRCGRLAGPVADIPEPAAIDSRRPCSTRAGDILAQILAMTNTTTKERLIGQWLDAASKAGRHPPFALLPTLLDYGTGNRSQRMSIAHVAGERGAWLARQNARWQFGASESEDPRQLFATGNLQQRVAAIRQIRLTDRAAARDLVVSTWKEDSAEERTAFVEALEVSLSGDDEAFLESALDDRSKQVRAAAAGLLGRLDGSEFIKRMIQRAIPLLNLRIARSGKRHSEIIEVVLPPDSFDPAWGRDGIVEKPDERIGRRQWWLKQIVARVPPAFWSERWKLDPSACVGAAAGEFADVLLAAWSEASAAHPDPDWIAALLLAAAKQERGPLVLPLLNLLPLDRQQALTTEILSAASTRIDTLLQLLAATTFLLDRDATRALCQVLEKHLSSGASGYDPSLRQALSEAALRIPPGFGAELADRWVGPQWEPHRKALDEFFLLLHLRSDLQRELQP